MIELQPRLIFLIVFTAVLGAFLYWDRKNVQRHYILFYRRTKKGLDFIDRVAFSAPKFWSYYGWAGVVTGIVSVFGVTALTAYGFVDMLKTQSAQSGPSLLLPGLVSESQFQAGASFIPVEYWVISIAVLMFVHEMSHGIVARVEGFELNSVGWILIGILPGAFVEPKGENMLPGEDGEMEERSGPIWEGGSWKSRLKVLCAGSFANYLAAALFFGLAIGGTAAVSQPSDVQYVAEPNYPAANASMNNGTLIQINGQPIQNIEDVRMATENISVGEQVDLWTSEGNFTVITTEREGHEGGYIGIRMGQTTVIKDSYESYQAGLQWFFSMLYTVGLLNLMIGFFNMLPIKPLDGGLAVETLVTEFLGEEKVEHVNTISLIGWALLLTALVAALLGFGG